VEFLSSNNLRIKRAAIATRSYPLLRHFSSTSTVICCGESLQESSPNRLAEHFAITHFAHLDEVMGKSAHGAFGGMRVERVCPGDVPDYLCARIAAGPFIAEAKGRFSSIGFHSAAFNNWRTQFTRIELWIPRMFLEAQRDISSRHDWSQTPIPLKIERQATSRIQTLRASHFQNKIDQCWVGVP